MDIHYLYEFTVLAENLSFSIAAEELYINQSSLSKHIASMEKELGVRLLNRSTHQVVLSEYGKTLLPYATEISRQYRAASDAMEKAKAAERGRLQVASIPVLAQYGIIDTIAAFCAARPDIELQIKEVEAKDISRLLSQENCELAFQRLLDTSSAEFEYTKYCDDTLAAVLPCNHPLADRNQISLSALKDEVFLLLDENTLMYSVCLDACRKAGFLPQMAYKGHRPENIIDLVSKGMGISLLMKRQVSFFPNPGISILDVMPDVCSSIYLINKKNHALSPAARAFRSFVAGAYDGAALTHRQPEFQ